MSMLLAEVAPVIQEVHVYGIGWGTLSLINTGLAQAKKRSGLAWWLASIFLGPIATFFIVVLPANEKVADERSPRLTPSVRER